MRKFYQAMEMEMGWNSACLARLGFNFESFFLVSGVAVSHVTRMMQEEQQPAVHHNESEKPDREEDSVDWDWSLDCNALVHHDRDHAHDHKVHNAKKNVKANPTLLLLTLVPLTLRFKECC